MVPRIYAVALSITVILLAGCSAPPLGATPPNPSADEYDSPSDLIAKQRALTAEEKRVEQALVNTSSVNDDYSVGVYGTVNATVAQRTANGVFVHVVMSYSYQYECQSGGGYVDGKTTETTYLVTENETTLQNVEQAVNTLC